MSRSTGTSTQLIAFLLGGVGLFLLMAWTLGFLGGSSQVRYLALLDDAAGIVSSNAVKIAGVSVGQVESVGVKGHQAQLWLRVDEDVPLYQDSQVSVRAKSLLGEKYIELVPGTEQRPRLAAGATIQQGHGTFEVDQLLNSLRSLMGEEVPLSQRLASLLERSDRLMAHLEDPEVERAMAADLARVRLLLDETGKISTSVRMILDGQEEHLQQRLHTAADWMGDPRWARIVGRLDKISAQLERDLPGLLASVQRTADASSHLMTRADAHLDDRTMKALAGSVRDLSEISTRGAALAKDVAHLQKKLKQGPLRAEEVGALLHALNQLSQKAAKLDEPAMRRFLQQEGVKVYVGRASAARRRLEAEGIR